MRSITDKTTYVNGEPQFTTTYTVENVTGKGVGFAPSTNLSFHAMVAGDLFVANDDQGTGVFLGGPPKFIGGQNPHTGTLGGFIEATPAWTNYQEGYWNGPFTTSPFAEDHGIWNAVRTSAGASSVFNDTIDPNLIDNGAGVSWDRTHHQPARTRRKPRATRSSTAHRSPRRLACSRSTRRHTVGQTATVTVTATDNVGTPYAGRSLVYSIGGANPKSGSVITNSSGVATISYVGTNAGLDTMKMFLDLAGTGIQAAQDPASAAQITWLPAAPTPNSSYKVKSIKANSDGTITITFVPTQSGQATLEVTVPTASISRREAIAARHGKAKGCKKGQTRIKGKCRPTTTVSGKVSANGLAGVPLTLTVKALEQGRKPSQERKDGPPHGDPHLQVLARRQADRAGLPRDGQRQEAQAPRSRQALAGPFGSQVCSQTGRHWRPVCFPVEATAPRRRERPRRPSPAGCSHTHPHRGRLAALLRCIQWP